MLFAIGRHPPLMHLARARHRAATAEAMAEALDADPATVEVQRFPDGERLARIEARLDDHVVLLHDLRPDERIVEALSACDAAREAGAETVTLAVPYLAYARQDRSFEHGEGVTSRALYRALSANADRLVTVDPHTSDVLGFFEGPTVGATAVPELADALGDHGVDSVLAPDEGARGRASDVAERLGCSADHLEKTRHSAEEVSMTPAALDVAGETVAIVDDIISTGGTMSAATRHLLDAGAERVLVAATHGVFAEGADKRLDDAGVDELVVTDAIDGDRATVSCAPALARGVRSLPSP